MKRLWFRRVSVTHVEILGGIHLLFLHSVLFYLFANILDCQVFHAEKGGFSIRIDRFSMKKGHLLYNLTVHICYVQVHPYTYRNENQFLHFDFHQDPYAEYIYWVRNIGVDGLFTDFTGSLHQYQEWASPLKDVKSANALFHEISAMIN
ncbi:glycerophosphodiester phosphodiesterase GDPD6 isoform X1 [Carex littledalei]|uniref:glycerophosphodiester phosphodiesterase n=1 Tax=Carex littledalei TaxID=544730 RepID=A0A833V7F7_9POAL|nr:glycerophosphodiester phosphodiesterase GDPD6 isoform X1 [Carex littledalei]